MAVEILSKNAVRQRQAADDEQVAAVTVATWIFASKRILFAKSPICGAMQRRVLMIGRYLNRAKTMLPHGEFQHMIKAELPFSEQVAYEIRQSLPLSTTGESWKKSCKNYSVATN